MPSYFETSLCGEPPGWTGQWAFPGADSRLPSQPQRSDLVLSAAQDTLRPAVWLPGWFEEGRV